MGKCTTDHISAAGSWLRYRGHLENISGNLFLGAINAYSGEAGIGLDVLDGERKPFPEIAKHYHEAGQGWVAIGDENYGEGSSREHAAMEPRFRNAKAVISRSFARIAETNLKKQGVLPLWFADRDTYDQIGEQDRISAARPGPVRSARAGRDPQFDGNRGAVHLHPHHERRADRLVPCRGRPQHHPQPPGLLITSPPRRRSPT